MAMLSSVSDQNLCLRAAIFRLLLCAPLVNKAHSFTQIFSRQDHLAAQTRKFESRPIVSNLYYSTQEPGDDGEEGVEFFQPDLPDDSREQIFPRQEIERLTVNQLKQQLRLRGLKVTGRKADLVDRFMNHQRANSPFFSSSDMFGADSDNDDNMSDVESKRTKARQFAQDNGNDLVDVSEYVADEDVGKDTKTWKPSVGTEDLDDEEEEQNASVEPEVWGQDARIVDDYEEGRLVVDCLSKSAVEYKGSNQTSVQAFVVASRDALKPFLSGGRNPQNASSTPAEERLREIQTRREEAARRPIRLDDSGLLDDGDETGLYENALHRDYSDWGAYSTTGAQLSAAEVQGVLLLSDVFGPFSEDTRALAEKIAFECQPVVVMAPDLFRGDPWVGPTSGTNPKGQTYEQWRAGHSDFRVNIDIRAAAACLRERYGVTSVAVWGTCYGGGRALEAAAGWIPNRNVHDANGQIGPPPVDPMACIAWYPTRYNVDKLFGADHMGTLNSHDGEPRSVAVMAVFAGKDTIPGAQASDAEILKGALAVDERVKDYVVKVFENQDHGFAHVGLSRADMEEEDFNSFVDEEFGAGPSISLGDGDSEVACLLSTAFMETYSRVFLPTVGPPISLDEEAEDWNSNLAMNGKSTPTSRDIRKEIEDAEKNFVEEPLGGYRIDPTDEAQDGKLGDLLRAMEGPEQKASPFALEDDDDVDIMMAKLKAYDEDFQLF
mmetsp:Transcript_16211/g.38239  ORF Transcript_16211/g.38239 Transcript_16211/m.38239 type:complete len:719 (-) Transcript_16211:548-2704(-)